MKTLVFVYGTLKRGYGNNRFLLSESRFVGEAVTERRFQLFDRGAYPYMARIRSGIQVKGEVWEVDSATLKNLDRLEGVPYHYRRVTVKVAPNGSPKLTAQAYVCLRNRYTDIKASYPDCGDEWKGKERSNDDQDDSY